MLYKKIKTNHSKYKRWLKFFWTTGIGDNLPGDVIKADGHDHDDQVYRFALNIWDNFCLASFPKKYLS